MKTTAISTPKRFIFAQLHAQLNEDGLRSFYGRVTFLSTCACIMYVLPMMSHDLRNA